MPRLLSIGKDRNCQSQINERSLKKYFSAAVSPSLIARTARKVGLKQRKCRFNPVSFITSIIVQAGSQAKFTITSICARYAALSGQSMEVKPFHNKIKRPAVTELTGMLLKHYADLLSAKFVKPKQGSLLLNTLREHGLAVDDIEAIDGSYWHVNNKLAAIFPGARTAAKGEELRDTYDETGKPVRKTSENAQIGMQTVFSLVSGMFKAVTFTAGTPMKELLFRQIKNIPYLKSRTSGKSTEGMEQQQRYRILSNH